MAGRRPEAGRPGGRAAVERVVVVRRRSELEELVLRFGTPGQARFYLEHAGQDFEGVRRRHERIQRAIDTVLQLVPQELRVQVVERELLPEFHFLETDLVVTVGPDGLVVNTAKYLEGQAIVPVNPDPEHIDGVLLPFTPERLAGTMERVLEGRARIAAVTLAEARLDDGQTLLAFNDLFVGARSHVTARYEIRHGGHAEMQASSGVIVSTGAGSTGWLRSVYAGAAGLLAALGADPGPLAEIEPMPWDTDRLVFAVREPFPSKTTATGLVHGVVTADRPLELVSHMAENGVVFSDGIERDYLPFNAGSRLTIGLAGRKAHLVVA